MDPFQVKSTLMLIQVEWWRSLVGKFKNRLRIGVHISQKMLAYAQTIHSQLVPYWPNNAISFLSTTNCHGSILLPERATQSL
jgi:hypothetical protein